MTQGQPSKAPLPPGQEAFHRPPQDPIRLPVPAIGPSPPGPPTISGIHRNPGPDAPASELRPNRAAIGGPVPGHSPRPGPAPHPHGLQDPGKDRPFGLLSRCPLDPHGHPLRRHDRVDLRPLPPTVAVEAHPLPPFLASTVVASTPTPSRDSFFSRYPHSRRRRHSLSHTPWASHSLGIVLRSSMMALMFANFTDWTGPIGPMV